jgi:hypothetical protein
MEFLRLRGDMGEVEWCCLREGRGGYGYRGPRHVRTFVSVKIRGGYAWKQSKHYGLGSHPQNHSGSILHSEGCVLFDYHTRMTVLLE